MLTHKTNTLFLIAVTLVLGVSAFFYTISWLWFLIAPVVWLVGAIIGSGLVWTGYHLKTYCKKTGVKDNIIAISFDDGPTPETLKVLALLKKYDAKATFFCIGKQIEKHPDVFKQIIAEGHTVGNHTYSHQPTFGMFSKEKILEELNATNRIINGHSGLKAAFFRPPYGVTSPNLAKALKATNHSAIGWNIRSLDAVIKSENRIFNRIKNKVKPGSIILLHDTTQKTVNVLEQLLVLLQQRNYKMVTIDHLLNIPAYEK